MGVRESPARQLPEPALHEIRVQGHLDDRWAGWAEGLTLARESDGTTTLTAPIADQAALHGLLNRIRDLNVTIVSVRRADGERDRCTTMRAIVQDAYGSADALRLREIARPAVGYDDVLLRVRAAALHIGDWHVMTGRPYLMRIAGFGFRGPKARVRGMDVAGTVEAIGKNVTRLRPGDDVFGTCDGAFAEYALARAQTLAPKAADLGFEQAAALPTSACTALQALRDAGGIAAGQRVLIVGASGGIGLFAVQIAKAFGAEVTGVCGPAKADLVRSLGADRVVDYTREDVAAGGQRYDLILDMVGNRSLSQLRHALAPRGTAVLVGGETGGRLIGALGRSLRGLVISPFVSQSFRMLVGAATAEDLRALTALVAAGKLTPVVDRTYPLDEAPEAMRYLEGGRARGKVVVTP